MTDRDGTRDQLARMGHTINADEIEAVDALLGSGNERAGDLDDTAMASAATSTNASERNVVSN
jgi:hypothetical protein